MTNPNIFWFATSVCGRMVSATTGCSLCTTIVCCPRPSIGNALAVLLGRYKIRLEIGCQDAEFVKIASEYTLALAMRAAAEDPPKTEAEGENT